MPMLRVEKSTVQELGREFETLGRALRTWPAGSSTSGRGGRPAKAILTSVRRVNSKLRTAAARGSISPASFRAMGRDFGTIATALRRAGAAAKKPAKRTVKRTARR